MPLGLAALSLTIERTFGSMHQTAGKELA